MRKKAANARQKAAYSVAPRYDLWSRDASKRSSISRVMGSRSRTGAASRAAWMDFVLPEFPSSAVQKHSVSKVGGNGLDPFIAQQVV